MHKLNLESAEARLSLTAVLTVHADRMQNQFIVKPYHHHTEQKSCTALHVARDINEMHSDSQDAGIRP